jgi:ankyrin repeat protein
MAIQDPDLDFARMLLTKCSPDLRDCERRTALATACDLGKIDAVRLLLESGAGVGLVDRWRQDPLFYAVFRAHEKIVNILLELGADPDRSNYARQTARKLAERAKDQGDAQKAIAEAIAAIKPA